MRPLDQPTFARALQERMSGRGWPTVTSPIPSSHLHNSVVGISRYP